MKDVREDSKEGQQTARNNYSDDVVERTAANHQCERGTRERLTAAVLHLGFRYVNIYNNRKYNYSLANYDSPEVDMDRVHPRFVSGWVQLKSRKSFKIFRWLIPQAPGTCRLFCSAAQEDISCLAYNPFLISEGRGP